MRATDISEMKTLKNKLNVFILDILFPPTADMLADRYLKKYGYPKTDKTFIGGGGDVRTIIGSETFLNVVKRIKEWELKQDKKQST